MTSYVALFRKDKGSDYGVEFPDFPGCVTAGKSLDDTRRMAGEALALHIEGMLEDGEAIPEPSSLDHIMLDVKSLAPSHSWWMPPSARQNRSASSSCCRRISLRQSTRQQTAAHAFSPKRPG